MRTAYIFLAVLILLMYSMTLWGSSIEGFEDGGSHVYEDADSIYDSTYASIYNPLWYSNDKTKFEQVSMQDLALADWPVSKVNVLDMMCNTAPHACWFKGLGVKYLGVDTSDALIAKARQACAGATFQKGDVSQSQLFPPKTFTHALLLNFGVYRIPNAKIFSDNAYQWLEPEGVFVVHMVDPDKFDPVLDLATPFAAFSLQKYSYDRVTDSEIFFDKFKYHGRFNKKKDDDDATFHETLTYYDPENNGGMKYRENIHHWTMPSKERLIDIFKTSGFRHKETVHLVSCSKEYQYLVYFTK